MAASPRPPWRKTASRLIVEIDRCTHTLEVASYSLHKGTTAGTSLPSATFAAGGHDWCLAFFPNGDDTTTEEGKDHVSVHLKLVSKATGKVTVAMELKLVNQITGISSTGVTYRSTVVFESKTLTAGAKFNKSELEVMPYLKDDRVVIECNLRVPIEMVQGSSTVCEIQVPPSDLSGDLGKLLDCEEGKDVAFDVAGEIIRAHRIVLAVRSPVFKAELYGPMSDTGEGIVITVDDMEPVVFRALLRFIYTDSLPGMDDLDGEEVSEMIKHLLVAADRYAMERMKLLCESILCKRLDVESAGITLALADQHSCAKLKDVCIEFINSLGRNRTVEKFIASQGYGHLKRACPALFVDMWEKVAKSRRI
ncbi:hypothetical protein HU200_061176 [Digitaria exilis]|uniref:Uncharacterized protein n=1 Tax=Digitaria exilis TaxID=1010633 RepID=A0A835AD32_9POAL|nr:hypothetical protein HU200_061176 [Digitaria exilis]CAB3482516.1 unnamed protein product [Digitaria exilis]